MFNKLKKWWKSINTPYEREFYKRTVKLILTNGKKAIGKDEKYYSVSQKDYVDSLLESESLKCEEGFINTKSIERIIITKEEKIICYFYDEWGKVLEFSQNGATKEEIEKHNRKVLEEVNE